MGKSKNESHYAQYVGRQWYDLTIAEILPREDGNHIMVRCRCVCGRVRDVALAELQRGNARTCGHHKSLCEKDGSPKKPAKIEPIADTKRLAVRERLNCKVLCQHPDPGCYRSTMAHVCCRECDRDNICGVTCVNSPETCGATYEEDCGVKITAHRKPDIDEVRAMHRAMRGAANETDELV